MKRTGSGALLPVLRAIGARGIDAAFCERPEVEGCSAEQVDAAVDELRRCGYVVTADLPGAFSDNPRHWRRSVLTVLGRRLLEDLERSPDRSRSPF